MDSVSKVTNVVQPQQNIATEGVSSFKQDHLPLDKGDASQFQAALQKHQSVAEVGNRSASMPVNGSIPNNEPASGKTSLGDKILARANTLAGEVKADQAYVSRLLEQATRTGDSMQMMKAMMALSDYQTRVQFVAKTVSKATSSVDQLTRLQ